MMDLARLGAIERVLIEVLSREEGLQLALLFGSFADGRAGPESDVDVLVRFQEHARPTLFDMVRMQNELEGIFGRKVDLVSRRGLEKSRNHIRRNAILQSVEVIHGS